MFYFKASLLNSRISTKLFVFLAVIVFSIFFISPLAILSSSKTENIEMIKVVQLITTIGIFILPSFVMAYFMNERPLIFLGLTKKNKFTDFAFVFLFMILLIPFINLLGELNQRLILPKAFAGMEAWMKTAEQEAARLTEKLVQVRTISGLLFNIFLIAILPAFSEELFFRGALQGILRDWKGVKLAIWITAIVFSAIHLQFYGFVPRMLMGAFFGYLLFWSNNIWLPIAAHFVNNVLAIIFYYLKYNGYHLPDIDTIGTGNTLWLGIASGALTIFGFFQLKKHFQS